MTVSRDADGKYPAEALAHVSRERSCACWGRNGAGRLVRRAGAVGARLVRPSTRWPAGNSGWRYFANLNHTIELDNQIPDRPGLAPLDQLYGQGNGTFGLPRHSSRLESGLFARGIGFRLSGIYTGEPRL